MSSLKVVVFGANSFSGQDFVDLLLDNPATEVFGVSRSPERDDLFLRYKLGRDLSRYRYYQLDMNYHMEKILALLDLEKPAYIVNFSAQSEVAPSWDHPEDWFQTNTVALSKLVNHLRRQTYLRKYVHISSPEAYGSCIGRVLESAPLNPSTPYAASKAAADMILNVYAKQFQFPVVTVRATNVYGARQQLFKIIPRTVIYLMAGKRIELHGGGKAVKSYIHVRDVSHGELAIMERGEIGQIYNLSPDQGVAVADIVMRICHHLGKNFAESITVVEERPGQDAAYVIDSSKARSKLNWAPKRSLETGLAEVVEWVEHYWERILVENMSYQHKA